MVKVKVSRNLQVKLYNLKRGLPLVVERSLSKIGRKIRNDIINGLAVKYSPGWQSVITRLSPNVPYFTKDNPEFGLMDALAASSAQIKRSTDENKNTVLLSLFDKASVRALTKMSTGGNYADLFFGEGNYKRSKSTRAGGSKRYGFAERRGFGNRNEGFMEKNSTHPGVLQVPIFEEVMAYWRPRIKRIIKKDIQTFTRGLK